MEAQAAALMTICSDKIPQEVFITPYIQSISLLETEKTWIDAILKYREGYERENCAEIIKQAGYDIGSTADKMQKFYVNLNS